MDAEDAPLPLVTRRDRAAGLAMIASGVTEEQIREMLDDADATGLFDRAARAGLPDATLAAMRAAADQADAMVIKIQPRTATRTAAPAAVASAAPPPLPLATTIKNRRTYKRRPVRAAPPD